MISATRAFFFICRFVKVETKDRIGALADLEGRAWHSPPIGPNSFFFTYIFTEKRSRRRSTPPPTGPRPPTGNPGSATGELQ